jgi:hypothetical protein
MPRRVRECDEEVSEDAIIIVAVSSAAVALIGLIVVLVVRRERKRREGLAAVAGQIGARFQSRPDGSFARELRDVFWVFRGFRGKGVTNLIEHRSAGASYNLFDYAYWRSGSKTPSTWSVLLVRSPRLHLPHFNMGNRGDALRLRDSFTGDPVSFSVREFEDRHKVHGDDRHAIQQSFTEDLQRFLAERPDYCMEGRGGEFVLYVPDRRVAPDTIRRIIDDGVAIIAEFGGTASPMKKLDFKVLH